jgi:cysteinyl-tRNA synthetase
MTIRRGGRSVVYPAGSVVPFEALAEGALTEGAPASGDDAPSSGDDARGSGETEPAARLPIQRNAADQSTVDDEPVATSLRAAADATAARFDAALAVRDVDGCVEAVLALEQALLDWAADTLSSDEGDHARSRLREMVVRLGELASVGARDPRDVIGPFVTALLDIRDRARAAKDFATSDQVRDVLTGAGVEVRDTPDGAQWLLAPQ